MKLMKNLFVVTAAMALAGTIHANTNTTKPTYDASVLPPGAKIVAGDLSKNEFFILAGNEKSQQVKSAAKKAVNQPENKQLVPEVQTALNQTIHQPSNEQNVPPLNVASSANKTKQRAQSQSWQVAQLENEQVNPEAKSVLGQTIEPPVNKQANSPIKTAASETSKIKNVMAVAPKKVALNHPAQQKSLRKVAHIHKVVRYTYKFDKKANKVAVKKHETKIAAHRTAHKMAQRKNASHLVTAARKPSHKMAARKVSKHFVSAKHRSIQKVANKKSVLRKNVVLNRAHRTVKIS